MPNPLLLDPNVNYLSTLRDLGVYLDRFLSLIEVDHSFWAYDFKCLHDSSWPKMFLLEFVWWNWHLIFIHFHIPKYLSILYGCMVLCSIDCLGWVCFSRFSEWLIQSIHDLACMLYLISSSLCSSIWPHSLVSYS